MLDGPTLTLEETLTKLLAMVGAPVDVHVRSTEPEVTIANFYGTLVSRGDVRHPSRRAEGEAFEFVVMRGRAEATFCIEQRAFAGAAYVDLGCTQGGELEVHIGSTIISIDWRADRPASAH